MASRTLLVESRGAGAHLLRLAIGGIVLLYLYNSQLWIDQTAAPGLSFFYFVSYVNLMFTTLAGMSFFAACITEEREAGTLDLLRIADVKPLAILIGKWAPKLLTGVMLVGLQIPFTILAITLGGISWDQILAVYAALLTHLLFVGSVGLLLSTYSATSTQACMRVAVLFVVSYVVPPILRAHLFNWFGGNSLVMWATDHVTTASAFVRVNSILSATKFVSDDYMAWQGWSNVSLAVLVLFWTWWRFDDWTCREVTLSALFPSLRRLNLWGTLELVTLTVSVSGAVWLLRSDGPLFQATTTGAMLFNGLILCLCSLATVAMCMRRLFWLLRRSKRSTTAEITSTQPHSLVREPQLSSRRTRLHTSLIDLPNRPWSLALVWKDFVLTTGGWTGISHRLLFYLAATVLLTLLLRGMGCPWNMLPQPLWLLGTGLFSLDVGLVAAQLFRNELHDQTWTTLLMLPRTFPQIVYAKLTGAAVGLAVGAAWVCLLFMASCLSLSQHSMQWEEWILLSLATTAVPVIFNLVAAISIVFPSLAWPISLFLGWTITFVSFVIFMATLVSSRSGQRADFGTFIMCNGCMLTAAVVLHVVMVDRLQRAEQ